MTEPTNEEGNMEACSNCGELVTREDLFSDPAGGSPLCEECLEELEQKDE